MNNKTGRTLVVYYSWSNGNTRNIAKQVQKAMQADIAEIETVIPYSGDYNDVVNQGQEEVNNGFKPAIRPMSVNPADYDTIAVGTPTWWYTMAPAVSTFLSENDWTGKTVIPFMTNGGWPGHVIKDMEKACEGAVIAHEKEIQFDSNGGDQMMTSQKELNSWLDSLK